MSEIASQLDTARTAGVDDTALRFIENNPTGGQASSVDFAPNAQQREVYGVLNARVLEYQAELKEVIDNDLAAFNRLVRDRNMVGIIATTMNSR